MTEWIIEVNDGQEVLGRDDGLYDVIVSDTFNPFGNYAKGFFDDVGGELFDIFQRGTKVSFQYSNENTNGFEQRFVGYVVNDLAQEADGAEQVEVEAYTFDQFLRGDEVSNDQTGNTIFEALEDVITTDVPPVSFDASLVEVVDDIELTQSHQGETVEEFLLSVRQKSGGEIFGVTETLEFFFEPSEIDRTRRDIDNSQWITHDIGEESGESKNQVTVIYADGQRSVIVEDAPDQLELQDNLVADGPGQEGERISRDRITDRQDAIAAGEQFLNGRRPTLTGAVTTFDLISATPGDVVGVTIEPRGIDTDFRIAENRIQWRSETNELTVVEKKGADDDILIEQSKTLKRVETRGRELDAIEDRTTDTQATALFDVTASTDSGINQDIGRIVNDGRNAIRDAIINETALSGFNIIFSDAAERPLRSDSSLPAVDTTTATVSTGTTSIEYSGSTTSNGIRTIGVEDGNGELLFSARLAETVDAPSVTLTVEIANDFTRDQTLWTTDGLQMLRDICSTNAPDWPQDYAYGTSDTDPSESDTSLGNEVARRPLADIIIQDSDDFGEWESLYDVQAQGLGAQTPVRVTDNNELALQQSSFFIDPIEDGTFNADTVSDSDLNGGQAIGLWRIGHSFEIDLTIGYEWRRLQIPIRFFKTGLVNAMRVSFAGQSYVEPAGQFPEEIDWLKLFELDGEPVEPGTYTLRAEIIDADITPDEDNKLVLDVLNPRDDLYDYNNDNSTDSDDNLSGPELFPTEREVELNRAPTKRVLDQVDIRSTWNDTSGNQEITVTGEQGDSITATNSDSLSGTLQEGNGITTSFQFSRYTEDSSTSPTSGDAGQVVSEYEAEVNTTPISTNGIGEGLARVFIAKSAAVGDEINEAGIISESNVALTRSRVPAFTKQSGQQIISNERIQFKND